MTEKKTNPADVNGDGTVDIHDVNETIGAVLTDSTDKNYDVNQDGRIDIGDVADVIDATIQPAPWDGKTTVNGVTFRMIPVKPGTFIMGSPSTETGSGTNERPQHEVTLTKEYYIGETQVTQALWIAVMGTNPSSHKGNKDLPVEHVSFIDCQAFIAKLNELTGKKFRLPTEAEWEFAARGGTLSKGYMFPGTSSPQQGGKPKEYIWYTSNSNGTTQPVAQKQPNELGIYDMGGNVFEWCQDWYKYPYPSEPVTDPTGPTSGSMHVYRGGAYNRPVNECRSAYRYMGVQTFKAGHVGLRLALDLE
jgi:formylglycine-generating enzyme required for sulfatase activity